MAENTLFVKIWGPKIVILRHPSGHRAIHVEAESCPAFTLSFSFVPVPI